MVIVRVEVKDQRGWYVFNLRTDDFVVYENGNQQRIAYFTREVTDPDSPWIGYTIGYYPIDARRDGRPRKIRVRVLNGGDRGLKAHCLPNFYTPEPEL